MMPDDIKPYDGPPSGPKCVVCPECFNPIHWITLPGVVVFWCASCRRDLQPADAFVHPWLPARKT